MEKNFNDEIEIDLLELLYLLKTRLWILLLTAIIFASGAGLVSSFLITPMYQSTTKLYILTKSTSITSLADIQLGTQLTQDYMVLIKSRPVVTKVIENLGLDMSYGELVDIITISNPSNTRILEIHAEYSDAFVAKQIVDEFAKVSRSQIAKIMDTSEPTVVEEGFQSPYPSSPNIKKNIMIAGLVGIVLSAGIIIVMHLMDDTIKTSEDVDKYLGLTTLGLIPVEQSLTKGTDKNKKQRQKKALARKGMR
ncbi:MAG: Capsular polysaccharide biosynthesis protein [Herbinix sp.]|jgi:capsular polysaccharide biosynthesis protein|nr:Capsular polysaccharide biosynthesis protein [Herbinix sp.]